MERERVELSAIPYLYASQVSEQRQRLCPALVLREA